MAIEMNLGLLSRVKHLTGTRNIRVLVLDAVQQVLGVLLTMTATDEDYRSMCSVSYR
jgi:hypothetical protein